MIVLVSLSVILGLLIAYSAVEQVFFPDYGVDPRSEFSKEEQDELARYRRVIAPLTVLAFLLPGGLLGLELFFGVWRGVVEDAMGLKDVPAGLAWSGVFVVPFLFLVF